MDKNEICGSYVGVACVDGSCPIANSDRYAECGMDIVMRCADCFMNRGCSDCALYGTEYCKSPLAVKQS